MTIGKIIKQRRKELNISATELAEKIGVSRSTLFRYENGDIEKIPSGLIEPLDDILQVTSDYSLEEIITLQDIRKEINRQIAILLGEVDRLEKIVSELEEEIEHRQRNQLTLF